MHIFNLFVFDFWQCQRMSRHCLGAIVIMAGMISKSKKDYLSDIAAFPVAKRIWNCNSTLAVNQDIYESKSKMAMFRSDTRFGRIAGAFAFSLGPELQH
jgi:hypothetical protein